MTPSQAARDVFRKFYGDWRLGGKRPTTDADMLRAVAAKFDEMDAITQVALGARARVPDDVQRDLRRIADAIEERRSVAVRPKATTYDHEPVPSPGGSVIASERWGDWCTRCHAWHEAQR